jgi:hypothetical protein
MPTSSNACSCESSNKLCRKSTSLSLQSVRHCISSKLSRIWDTAPYGKRKRENLPKTSVYNCAWFEKGTLKQSWEVWRVWIFRFTEHLRARLFKVHFSPTTRNIMECRNIVWAQTKNLARKLLTDGWVVRAYSHKKVSTTPTSPPVTLTLSQYWSTAQRLISPNCFLFLFIARLLETKCKWKRIIF